MDSLLKIAVEKWCDEVRAHDNWQWGNTCENLLRDIDYHATSKITRECIRCTLTDGKPVELLRLNHGWGIRWGKDVHDLPIDVEQTQADFGWDGTTHYEQTEQSLIDQDDV